MYAIDWHLHASKVQTHNSNYHHSPFPKLLGSATWILALQATRLFQRSSIISRSYRSFLTALIEVFKDRTFCPCPAPICLSKHFLFSAVRGLLITWPYHANRFS